MAKPTKQEYVYQIVRALAGLPGAYQFRITSFTVELTIRPIGASANEYLKIFLANKIPDDIRIPQDAINCSIVLFGQRAALVGGVNLGDRLEKLVQAEGIATIPEANITVPDTEAPDAAYIVKISLWPADAAGQPI
jgi:hypothetical protein